MKRKLFKFLLIVMSVIMICNTISVCSMAGGMTLTAVEHSTPELEGYFTTNLLVNESNSVAFIEVADVDLEKFKYFYTTDGFSYRKIDFDSYAPKCDYVELAALDCDGENFVFLFYCYKVENVYDPDFKEYIEEYEAIDEYFLVTKDFKKFEKSHVNVQSDTQIYQGDYYYFTSSGVLKFIDGEWVFANGDYIVTGNEGNNKVGKGVYYTTKDFKKWDAHYTHEKVVWDGSECGFAYFTEYGGLFVFEDFDDSNVYLLLNDKVYGPFVYNYGSDVSVMVDYVYIHDSKSVLRFDTILTDEYLDDETGELYPEFRLVSIDINTGKKKELYKGDGDFYYDIIEYNDKTFLFVTSLETMESDVYELDKNCKFTKIDTSLNLEECFFAYQVGYNFFGCGYDEIRVCKGNLLDGYTVDLRQVNYKIVNFERVYLEFNEHMFAFEIGGKLIILETNPKAKRSVAYDISGVDTRLVGDANSDGLINSSDALKILQKASGLIPQINSDGYILDVDRNNSIQSADALRVLQYATGLVRSITK